MGWIQVWNEETLRCKHDTPLKSQFADIDHLKSHAAAGFFRDMPRGPEQRMMRLLKLKEDLKCGSSAQVS